MVVFVAILAFAAPAVAQTACGTIGLTCAGEGDFPPHVFYQDDFDGENIPFPAAFHGECSLCLQGSGEEQWEAPPYVCHWSECDPSDEQDEQQQLAYSMAAEAAAEGDTSRLLELAPLLPGRLLLNAGRQSLQLRGCGEEIVANLPLDTSEYRTAIRMVAAVNPTAITPDPVQGPF